MQSKQQHKIAQALASQGLWLLLPSVQAITGGSLNEQWTSAPLCRNRVANAH
jgi:hypothetical protein